MSTGSPGMIDHSLRLALTTLSLEKPRQRARSPYAIPKIIAGLENEERILARAVELARQQSS
ncbi:hypothetical protein [Methylorubrum extorquens]|uniref:hypothetical protein n=1 Tax=Methylorubrum extorquens TaxID=408 RepID=UPI00209F9F09|nr:hypothetical protein [Methylorubrum extorquens]MCP1540095.1 hypothetical protein [Methylorubrum extorquens]